MVCYSGDDGDEMTLSLLVRAIARVKIADSFPAQRDVAADLASFDIHGSLPMWVHSSHTFA